MNNQDNIILNIYNKTKQKLNDFTFEMKLENKFKKDNQLFKLYKKEAIFPIILGGYIDKNIIVYGNHIDKKHCVILNELNQKVLLIKNTKLTELKIIFDSIEYTRVGTIFEVDDALEEVDVIKVKDRYYKFKK